MDRNPTSATTFDSFDWARIAPDSFAQPRRWKQVRLEATPSLASQLFP